MPAGFSLPEISRPLCCCTVLTGLRSAGTGGDMTLSEYLERAIKECERRIPRLNTQQKIDISYINASNADPTDIEYYRFQVELQAIEQEYLQKKVGDPSRMGCVGGAAGFRRIGTAWGGAIESRFEA